jgi:hypothetical protein
MFDENARLRFDARRGLFLFKIDSLTHGVAFRDLIAQTPKKSRGTAAILKIRRHKIKRATKCSNIALNNSKLYKKWACRFDAKTTIDHFLDSKAASAAPLPRVAHEALLERSLGGRPTPGVARGTHLLTSAYAECYGGALEAIFRGQLPGTLIDKRQVTHRLGALARRARGGQRRGIAARKRTRPPCPPAKIS